MTKNKKASSIIIGLLSIPIFGFASFLAVNQLKEEKNIEIEHKKTNNEIEEKNIFSKNHNSSKKNNTETKNIEKQQNHHQKIDKNPFDLYDTENLEYAKKPEIIELKDGDTYEMVVYPVKQEVGNRLIKRLSYNGMIPGPIIKVEKNSKIKIKLTNKIGLETTLHSHGLRLDDSKFDGVPTDMGGEQIPIKPGESFVYELNFKDAGIFWYHPHIREDFTQEMGLYGNFLVEEENYWNKVDLEKILILDDFSTDDIFYKDIVNKTLFGRYGNIMMINNDENFKMKLKKNQKVRLFITNVANTRTFDFRIIDSSGKTQKLKLVGGDIGRIEKEKIVYSQIFAPAERYVFETYFSKAGKYLIYSKNRKLGEIIVEDSNIKEDKNFFSNLRDNSKDYEFIRKNLKNILEKEADKKIVLTIGMKGRRAMMGGRMGMMRGGMMGGQNIGDGIKWEEEMAMMNARSNDQMMEWKIVEPETGKENMEIFWKFKKGDLVKIKIYNSPNSMHPIQHPIHFHGQRFIILTRNGKLVDNFQWKDTALVKVGEEIEILVEMTNPGLWMNHCHIAEHLQSGMMMNFKVEE